MAEPQTLLSDPRTYFQPDMLYLPSVAFKSFARMEAMRSTRRRTNTLVMTASQASPQGRSQPPHLQRAISYHMEASRVTFSKLEEFLGLFLATFRHSGIFRSEAARFHPETILHSRAGKSRPIPGERAGGGWLVRRKDDWARSSRILQSKVCHDTRHPPCSPQRGSHGQRRSQFSHRSGPTVPKQQPRRWLTGLEVACQRKSVRKLGQEAQNG